MSAATSTAPTKVAVLGAGSMGTTFAMVLADAGCDVTLWGRDAAVLDAVDRTHRNEKYLPGVQLPAMHGTTDPAVALHGASITRQAGARQGRSVWTDCRERVWPPVERGASPSRSPGYLWADETRSACVSGAA